LHDGALTRTISPMRTSLLRAGLALALGIPCGALPGLLSGCAETPRDGFEVFFTAEARGQHEAATARLSSQARAALQSAGVNPTAARVRSTLRAIREVSRDGDKAVLQVEDALGKQETVHMRLEGGLWRVDVENG
jgi:hypothetical protein